MTPTASAAALIVSPRTINATGSAAVVLVSLLEPPAVTLAESQLVLASMARTRPDAGRGALAGLAAARNLHGFESALRRFAARS